MAGEISVLLGGAIGGSIATAILMPFLACRKSLPAPCVKMNRRGNFVLALPHLKRQNDGMPRRLEATNCGRQFLPGRPRLTRVWMCSSRRKLSLEQAGRR